MLFLLIIYWNRIDEIIGVIIISIDYILDNTAECLHEIWYICQYSLKIFENSLAISFKIFSIMNISAILLFFVNLSDVKPMFNQYCKSNILLKVSPIKVQHLCKSRVHWKYIHCKAVLLHKCPIWSRYSNKNCIPLEVFSI